MNFDSEDWTIQTPAFSPAEGTTRSSWATHFNDSFRYSPHWGRYNRYFIDPCPVINPQYGCNCYKR